MPKGLSSAVRDNLEKCRSAAIAAVDVYNRPGPRFRTAARAALAGTGLADHFYFGDALYWFKLAYSRYLAEQCSPEGYLKRAQRMVDEARAPTRSVEEVAQHLRATERESFEKTKLGIS